MTDAPREQNAIGLPAWLDIRRGRSPLIVSLPHTGTWLPPDIEARVVSPWLARKDADWWIDQLYDFAVDLDATVIRTTVSRTVIDVNRDPSGVSLYPGQATTELVPTTTFDGEPLWTAGESPGETEIAERRRIYFDPYHAALRNEIARLRHRHARVVIYDCHSIRSVIPRLFEGELPVFNIGTNSSAACDAKVEGIVADHCRRSGQSMIVNGRFKGGHITRVYGQPSDGVHAVQMELACRGYMREVPGPVSDAGWPVPYDAAYAAPVRDVLIRLLTDLRDWAA